MNIATIGVLGVCFLMMMGFVADNSLHSLIMLREGIEVMRIANDSTLQRTNLNTNQKIAVSDAQRELKIAKRKTNPKSFAGIKEEARKKAEADTADDETMGTGK